MRFLFHLLTLCAFLIVVLRRKRARYHFIHGSTTIIMVEEIKVNDCVAVNGGIYVGQCDKVIVVLECMYRIVLDGYEDVVVQVVKHNISKIAPSVKVKVFVPSVEVSNADDIIRHLYLLLYNTSELKRFFKGNDLVVDKLEAVRKSVDDAVDVIEYMEV
jgi:hypothetical protein